MAEQYHFQEGGMDILVMLEENPDHSPVLAHVNSVPSPLHSSERPSRDIVTLYGEPNPESVALALAAAVESHRSGDGRVDSIRQLGIWPERGAIGVAAWRDASKQLVERGVAGLWRPEGRGGARRGISVSSGGSVGRTGPVFAPLESVIERLR